MDWAQTLTLIVGLITGGGLSSLITLGLIHRQKKGEVAKLEVDVRKLQEGEFRDRAAQLINDLSEANATIKRISGELQVMIAAKADADIKIAHLEAEVKRLQVRSCKHYCTCLTFENDEVDNKMSEIGSV